MKKFLNVFCLCLILALAPLLSGCKSDEVNKVAKNLTKYSIEATLSEDMTIEASQSVDVINSFDAELDRLYFNLYPRAFRENAKVLPYTSLNEGKCFLAGKSYGTLDVKSVKVNGLDKEVKYAGEDENTLKVELGEILKPDERVLIEIQYSLVIPECTHRFGYFEGSVNLGNFYPILAMYENGEFIIAPYYSTGDPFYSGLANYEVNFTYPSKYYLSSSGEEVKSNEIDSNKTCNLVSLATRDFAIALTSEYQVLSGKAGDVVVNYVGYKEDNNANEALETAIKCVEYYSKTFGQYPYSKLDVVKAPFVHGGMEYPKIVIISDSITEEKGISRVIAHEIAHQWWYALVGNNQIKEAWLDESLAEYSSVLFFEAHSEYGLSYADLVSEAFAGYVLYADVTKTLSSKIHTSMLLPVNEYAGDYEYSYMIYVKGILMFDSLREVVSKEKLLKAFKQYFSKYKFKISTTDNLIASFEKTTKKDIGGFFDSWLQGKVVITTI